MQYWSRAWTQKMAERMTPSIITMGAHDTSPQKTKDHSVISISWQPFSSRRQICRGGGVKHRLQLSWCHHLLSVRAFEKVKDISDHRVWTWATGFQASSVCPKAARRRSRLENWFCALSFKVCHINFWVTLLEAHLLRSDSLHKSFATFASSVFDFYLDRSTCWEAPRGAGGVIHVQQSMRRTLLPK